MAEHSKAYSIFRYKCPHCHEGEFFVDRNPYHLSTVGDVLERCPVCERRYTPEPGFYYGGMYVAYALAVATCTTIYVATIVLWPSASTGATTALVLGGLIMAAPWLYAISKTLWANIFMGYKGVAPTEKERLQALERAAQREPVIRS
ncbi:MAG: DUF983 domain-containing protein [Flavobacteriales bacterium]|nr:DUF983 domain-containing protein [Flavobacteriales bacterium]